MHSRTPSTPVTFFAALALAILSTAASASGPTVAIQAILDADRTAHLTGDASLIASNLDATVVEVSGGAKEIRSREEIETFFRQRFDAVDYSTWRDTEPPTIRISAGGTMAWVVRSIYAELEVVDSDDRPGRSVEFSSVYTSTYELRDGLWKMTSVTSTFLPPPSDTAEQ